MRVNPALVDAARRPPGPGRLGRDRSVRSRRPRRAGCPLAPSRPSDGDGGRSAELRLAAGDGELPVAVVAAPVRDGHGQSGSVLLQIEDLRARRRAQAALERAAAERAARDEAEALAARLARVAAITDGLDALALVAPRRRAVPTAARGAAGARRRGARGRRGRGGRRRRRARQRVDVAGRALRARARRRPRGRQRSRRGARRAAARRRRAVRRDRRRRPRRGRRRRASTGRSSPTPPSAPR